MAMNTGDLVRKGRALKGSYQKNPAQVIAWIGEVERTHSSNLAWNTDLGIYISQLKNNPENSAKYDKVISELEKC